MAARTSSLRDQTARRDRGGHRALEVASCSLCGLERPIGLLVPDGGEACDDLRWYCKDARSCTERWTSRLGEPAETALTAESAPARTAPAGRPEQREPAEPGPDQPGPDQAGPDQPEPAEMAAGQRV